MYLTGGVTAVLHGWRDTTMDIGMRIIPERDELYAAITGLKNTLSISTEDVTPEDSIPVKPGWESRSPLIAKVGKLSVQHFDLYAQALSKIERATGHDLGDVEAMIDRGLITPKKIRAYFREIEPMLLRYIGLDADEFRAAVESFVNQHTKRPSQNSA